MRILKNLFRKKEDKNEILLERAYTQSERYKGFRRVHMPQSGYEPIEANMEMFITENPKLNLKEKEIVLQEYQYGSSINEKCILVKIDGYHLGTVFISDDTKDFYNAFKKDKIEGLYFRFSEEKIFAEEKGKIVEQTKIRRDLFALY